MDLNISKSALDRSLRISNPKSKKKSRPIIDKFVRYYDRRDVFINKRCLQKKIAEADANKKRYAL